MYSCCPRVRTAVAVLLAVVCTSFTSAGTWYVHPDSTLNTIQAGLSAAAAGDTVLVAPGTYNENIVWPSRGGIKLLSEFGPEVTVIDGNDARVIRMAKYLSGTTVVDGFTIQHGVANPPDPDGGGIHCDSASPTIRNNIFTSNSAYGSGGAIYTFHGSSAVKDNIISGNSATAGRGGGIYCGDSSNLTISENWIAGNSPGGGIECANALPGVTHNQILNNNASSDGGGCYFYVDDFGGEGGVVHENNIQGNEAYGLWVEASGYSFDAASNWWGHPAGPDSGDHASGSLGVSIFVYPWLTQRIVFDLAADDVLLPGDTVNPGSTYTPTIQVRNSSNFDYSATYLGATCWIGSYASYVRVDHPLARESTVAVEFKPWTVPPADSTSYEMMAVVHYAIDDVPGNDTIRKTIYARQAGITDRPADVPHGLCLRVDRSPFSHSLPIQYEVPTAGRVALRVHDAAGRLVATLAEGVQQRSVHSLTWAAAGCAPGVYFVDLSTNSGRRCLKVLLTR